MIIDGNSGNVGIGLTNPQTSVDMVGSLKMRLQPTSNNSGMSFNAAHESPSIGFHASDNSQRFTLATSISANNANDLLRFNGSLVGDILALKGNGNVGIGTTNPTSKLQVDGVVHSASGGFKFPDGTTQTTAAAGGLNGSGTTDNLTKFTGPTTVGNSIIQEIAGNLKIGSFSDPPPAKLNVREGIHGLASGREYGVQGVNFSLGPNHSNRGGSVWLDTHGRTVPRRGFPRRSWPDQLVPRSRPR